MSIGKKIKDYIDERGIKQIFLIEKTGLSQYTVSKSLNGEREMKIMEYYLICEALGVPFDTFIQG